MTKNSLTLAIATIGDKACLRHAVLNQYRFGSGREYTLQRSRLSVFSFVFEKIKIFAEEGAFR